MEVFAHKDFESLQKLTKEAFSNTILYNTSEGSVVTLITNAINSNIADLYNYSDQEAKRRMINYATGDDLDEIGATMSCIRNGITDDDEYREKIKRQALILEKGNETAIKYAARVTNVLDVSIKKGAFGSGTFAIFPIMEQVELTDDIIKEITENVSLVVSEGTTFKVMSPTYMPTKIVVKQIPNGTPRSDSLQTNINLTIQGQIESYLGTRNIGQSFSFDDLKRLVLEDETVALYTYTLELVSVVINDKEVSSLYDIGWNQRIIEHEDDDAITVE